MKVAPFLRHASLALFLGTLGMTWLTIVKELVLYQNGPEMLQKILHRLANRAYYPALFINLCIIVLMFLTALRSRRLPILLVASGVLFVINVILFSANNVINLLHGRPLHGIHHGIGW